MLSSAPSVSIFCPDDINKLPSNLVTPASTHSAYGLVKVMLVPAAGALVIYIVAASVVVTDPFVAASVPFSKVCNIAFAAVPLVDVLLSVYITPPS